MKKHFFFAILLASVLVSSCSSQKDFVIESDYSYNGRFKKYKTFDFIIMAENDTLIHKDLIEKTIASRMHAQGYRYSAEKPDLLITYKIFVENFAMKGYAQPSFDKWVSDNWSERLLVDDKLVQDPSNSITAEYNNQMYDMYDGTMLVSFFDRKRRRTVWQGYASGVFSQGEDTSDRSIKLATAKIFREFRIVANGYIIKKDA
ncbi:MULTISPECIES: DUF4136 domain-containing protein [Reichenbachiella]|uniref:DUF4136 domain-containing protein n=1 Tax=Reichenbachiella agariperforans TaxID=156994 RepID=A0A1M6SGX2_REIAG|nr:MULTISPECIES: DUF4136 domain-containing protein [Reichenbachiella]MBU2916137.1 DUF4136 domain-containing protein [Reichenbachiella agariperforans]RJE74996.1 hypothetical protein BGP76_17920 [Reichenbachiella sp. MSK19-1]SHK43910.1 protein of unknown function [Reichenbachiella agariperforans]